MSVAQKYHDPAQLPLLDIHDHGAYRWSDPDTSIEAALQVDATVREQQVKDAVRSKGKYGATCSEIVAITGLSWNTVSPRLAPLRRKGFLYDSGQRRLGPTNRKQIVWLYREK